MFNLFCATDENNRTLLENAVITNNRFLVSYIVRNIKTLERARQIRLAHVVWVGITSSTEDIVMLLLDNLFHTKASEHPLEHYMEKCVKHRKLKVVRMLLMLGANPNHIDTDGRSLLYNVVSIGDEYLVDVLVDHYHVDVNCVDDQNLNIVFLAIENNMTKISSALIMSGTDVNCKDTDGTQLIEVCIRKNWYLHVNYLLKHSAFSFCDNKDLFHKFCHIAVGNNSTIIFNKLLVNYCAVKIQRHWRGTKKDKKII